MFSACLPEPLTASRGNGKRKRGEGGQGEGAFRRGKEGSGVGDRWVRRLGK